METRKKKSFKRLFAFLMAFVMVASLAVSAVFAADPTFKDVPADHDFYAEIEDLYAKKVISGYGGSREGFFGPDDNLTRAQAAKMVALAAGYKVSKGFKTSFTDVDEDVDMYEHIWALEEAGIVKGFKDTKEFKPTEEIERGHVAKMVAQAFGIADGSKDVKFSDLPADEEVAKAIMALATNDIVKGYGDSGEFRPALPVTRGQFAKMVSRAMNLKLEIIEASAVNAKTVKATFNKELSSLALKDFSVYEKDDESAINVISKLAKKGTVATLALTNALEEDTDYILDVDGVGKAEFTYEEAEAASIAFVATTVKTGADVLYVIKDSAGNDITANYKFADLTVQTSAPSVVSTSLVAGSTAGYSVVNVKITDTEIETGNTVIEVKATLDVLTSVGRWTLNYDDAGTLSKPVTELFKSTSGAKFEAEALNQDGKVNDPEATLTYKSNSPAVLVVQPNGQTVQPISPGTASVVITATVGTKSVSKTVQVTVKADPKATSLEVEPKSVTLVTDSELTQDVIVKVLDQYGKKYSISANVTFELSKEGIVTAADVVYADGVATIVLTAGAKGSTTLKITYEDAPIKLTESVSVTVAEKAAPAGYAVEVKDTTLDLLSDEVYDYYDLAKGPNNTTVAVYEIDSNGNKTGKVTSFTLVPTTGSPTGKVSISGATVTAAAVGSQKIDVKVESTIVKTITFTVVNSTRALDKVVQLKNALTVDVNATAELFSIDTDEDKAFVGYDQYGDKFVVEANEYTIVSSDTSVVDNDGKAIKAGTAKLTIVFGELDLIFTIDIVVPKAV